MPDAIDDILGPEKGAGRDAVDDILGDAPAAPTPIVGLTSRPTRPMQPRSLTASDVDLGIESGPIREPISVPEIMGVPVPRRSFGAEEDVRARGKNYGGMFGPPGPPLKPQTELEGDPIAQAITAAALFRAGAALPGVRQAGGAIGARLGPLAAPAAGATEGAATTAMLGGDLGNVGTGALLGGGFRAFGQLGRAGEAAARAEARLTKDVNAGLKSNSKIANDVKFKAGEGNADLAQVANELPDVGKALKTQAKTDPAAAHKVTAKAVDELTDANDAAYAAIQRQHGGVKLQPIAERLAGLEERLNQQGRGVAADAVNRVRTDLLKRYGAGPDGLADARLSAQQIRNIRNDMGDIAFGGQIVKANTKRDALRKIYDILNKEIEDVAENTRGVDVEALRTRNRQISTLIPVQKALAQRADELANREIPGLGKSAKETIKSAGQRAVREIDYRLSRGSNVLSGKAPLPGSVPAAAAQMDRDFTKRVSDFMGQGMPLAAAVEAAGGD